MLITSPSIDGKLVHQQVRGLVHPVAEADRGEFDALAGRDVVVGEQRRRAVDPDALPQSLGEKCGHGASVGATSSGDLNVRHYPFRMRYVLIMAGGSGKRLWPLSRQDMPKQLLRVVGGKSLLRIAYERLEGIVPPDHVLVCTGADYADIVATELPELKPANILGEPEGRDSLNAVAWPAAVLAARDPDAVIAVVTSDHLMHPISAFQSALLEGFEVAESGEDFLVTFGVVPTAPHTGYGYSAAGRDAPASSRRFLSHRVQGETRSCRPPRSIWPRVSIGGTPACSSGAPVPCLISSKRCSQRRTMRCWSWPPHRIDSPEIYPELLKISVDYAVMEPVSRGEGSAQVVAVRLPITWHDVGGFAALGEQLPRDEHGNATHGVAVLVDARDNLVINNAEDGRVVAVVGLTDTVIVQTPQITLVCPITEAERIKELVAEVTAQLGGGLRISEGTDALGRSRAVGLRGVGDRVLGHEVLDRRSADVGARLPDASLLGDVAWIVRVGRPTGDHDVLAGREASTIGVRPRRRDELVRRVVVVAAEGLGDPLQVLDLLAGGVGAIPDDRVAVLQVVHQRLHRGSIGFGVEVFGERGGWGSGFRSQAESGRSRPWCPPQRDLGCRWPHAQQSGRNLRRQCWCRSPRASRYGRDSHRRRDRPDRPTAPIASTQADHQ